MVAAAAYWKALWLAVAAGLVLLTAGLVLFGTGLGTPLLALAAICMFSAVVLLRMWMWQKAYEGKPRPETA